MGGRKRAVWRPSTEASAAATTPRTARLGLSGRYLVAESDRPSVLALGPPALPLRALIAAPQEDGNYFCAIADRTHYRSRCPLAEGCGSAHRPMNLMICSATAHGASSAT